MRYLFDDLEKNAGPYKAIGTILFLDFDGTLSPLAEEPKRAELNQETKALLVKLAAGSVFRLAIVSGRELGDLRRKVRLKNVIYVGNHGLQIRGPKISFSFPLPPAGRKRLVDLKRRLHKRLAGIKGLVLEDKKYALSVHYRMVEPKLVPRMETVFHEETILDAVQDKIRIIPGKMVFEVRLPVDWDKGKIVLWLLARCNFRSGEKACAPVYIGDDTTDEDAFQALKGRGLTVFVGPGTAASAADYYVKDPGEVRNFLSYLANQGRGQHGRHQG